MEVLSNGNVILENVTIKYPNFSGRATDHNTLGARNFCVILSQEAADYLSSINCNVKMSKRRDDDPDYVPDLFVKVNVNYRDKKSGMPLTRPPKIYFINSKGKFLLSEETIKLLDEKRIISADIELNPWKTTNRMTGAPTTSLYVKELVATLEESYLDRKYADYDGPSIDLPFEPD